MTLQHTIDQSVEFHMIQIKKFGRVKMINFPILIELFFHCFYEMFCQFYSHPFLNKKKNE